MAGISCRASCRIPAPAAVWAIPGRDCVRALLPQPYHIPREPRPLCRRPACPHAAMKAALCLALVVALAVGASAATEYRRPSQQLRCRAGETACPTRYGAKCFNLKRDGNNCGAVSLATLSNVTRVWWVGRELSLRAALASRLVRSEASPAPTAAAAPSSTWYTEPGADRRRRPSPLSPCHLPAVRHQVRQREVLQRRVRAVPARHRRVRREVRLPLQVLHHQGQVSESFMLA